MLEWTCDRLHAQHIAENENNRRIPSEVLEKAIKEEKEEFYRSFPDFDEREAAYFGDIAPLRKRYPHLAEYLQLPPLERGNKYPKPPQPSASDLAKDTVNRIQKIWLEHFGKRRRRSGEGISAIEIAAEFLGISTDEINRKMKPSGRHKVPRKRKLPPS